MLQKTIIKIRKDQKTWMAWIADRAFRHIIMMTVKFRAADWKALLLADLN